MKIIELTDKEKTLVALARQIRTIREAAAQADQGRWFRSHSQIVSGSNKGGTLIALAEGMGLKGGWQPDMTKAAANARYITVMEPHAALGMCKMIEALQPELVTIIEDLRERQRKLEAGE